MRLMEIVAEWLYLQDNGYNSVRFANQESNIRDGYFRKARSIVRQLLQGYLGNKTFIANIVRGSITSFINAHGNYITKENMESLTKRILSNIRHTSEAE